MNPLKIKVCGMRNPENISALAELCPDYIGLIFYSKSKRFVKDSEAENIVNQIPDSIKKVGVFVNELQQEVLRKVNLFKLDLIQFHGEESVDYCKVFNDLDIPIIKAFGINGSFDFKQLKSYEDCCQYYLFDTKSSNYGGTGQKFNWSALEKYKGEKPVFLSGGIGPDDMKAIKNIKKNNIHAIDVNSRFEIEPGLKNTKLLSDFINELKQIK